MMLRHVLSLRMVVLLATAMTVAFTTGMDALTLPREVYNHMAGKWAVQTNAPCYPGALDNAIWTIANDSTLIHWSWGSDALRRAGAGSVVMRHTSFPLSQLTSALAVGITAPMSYVICDVQQNHIRTPERHATRAKMAQLTMQEYHGILTTSSSLTQAAAEELCEGTARRDVVMRVLIQPSAQGEKKKSKTVAKGASQKEEDAMDERAVMVDILIDSRAVSGNCLPPSHDAGNGAVGANDTKTSRSSKGAGGGGRARARRASGGKPSGASGSSKFDPDRVLDDVSSAQGFLTVHMVRQNSQVDASSRFRPFIMFTLMFAGIKIIPFLFNKYVQKM